MEWFDAHRLTTGVVLLVLFCVGIFGYYPFIADEWPRLDMWQRSAIWVADVTAIGLVIQWMLTRPPNDTALRTPETRTQLKWRVRWIATSLLLSLIVDIGVTIHGIYVEKAANERAVKTEASVVHVRRIPWHPVTHFKVTVEFRHTDGSVHRGLLAFTQKRAVFPPWIGGSLQHGLRKNVLPFTIPICYDPDLPPRVWTPTEPWNREHALAYAFLVVHIFQALVVGGMSFGAWFGPADNVSEVAERSMPIIALAVESAALALWGSVFRYRGF